MSSKKPYVLGTISNLHYNILDTSDISVKIKISEGKNC